MIVVAIIGILAAVAIPAYIGYLQRSKASEAFSNLGTMANGAISYYSGERWGARTVRLESGATLAVGACTVPPAATSNVPGPSKASLNWDGESPSFHHIGFVTRDPVYFQYLIVGSDGRCDHSAGEVLYSFRAYGDLDGDGQTSMYELAAGSGPENELVRTPGVYILSPYE